MSLFDIRGVFDCDGCGKQFSVSMDGAYKPPAGWSLFDCAEDAIRGGLGIEMKELPKDTFCNVSVQGGMHLCPICTNKVDEGTPDNPTPEQVTAALAP